MTAIRKSSPPFLFITAGSVAFQIWKQVIVLIILALGVSVLYLVGGVRFINQPILSNLIPGVVLGLLLVFRTNTAYERFWEGRKSVGGIIDIGRFLSRQLWVNIPERTPSDREDKLKVNRLLSAYFIAAKLYLRRETVDQQLAMLVTAEQASQLRKVENMPLKVAQWISAQLIRWRQLNYIDSVELTTYNSLVDKMVEYLGNCERILNTPLPKAYLIHLKHLVGLYLLATPFQLVAELGWLTAPVVGIIGFAFLGIEAIGFEIENPFGHDLNDIPMDRLCDSLVYDIEELYDSTPSALVESKS
jgi:putative membrane protein